MKEFMHETMDLMREMVGFMLTSAVDQRPTAVT